MEKLVRNSIICADLRDYLGACQIVLCVSVVSHHLLCHVLGLTQFFLQIRPRSEANVSRETDLSAGDVDLISPR